MTKLMTSKEFLVIMLPHIFFVAHVNGWRVTFNS